MKECDKFNFNDTSYEENFYASYINQNLYCLKNEDYIHLIGTRDWQYLNKDHAYIIISLEKCTE